MGFALLYSRGCAGIHAPEVIIEVNIAPGMPKISMVGLPEAAVRESLYRVRAALHNTHFDFPIGRITVNLAPANLPKDGARFDLPIALGILAASNQIPKTQLHQYEFAGELTLTGGLRPVKSVLPLAIAAKASQRHLVLPQSNAEEATLPGNIIVYPINHLLDICEHLVNNGNKIKPQDIIQIEDHHHYDQDMSDIKGQAIAKRALEIAAAGHHSLLLKGPPGTGKTMLASRLPSILPALKEDDALEVATIYSVSGKKFLQQQWRRPPFRSPHHTASAVALVGGGRPPRPGEISLAHHGVLFLDELPEYDRKVLETLREPLESGTITISRAAHQAEFPAHFQFIAAMNPCPCGHAGNPHRHCRCSPEQIRRYISRLSGPLLDRIDMHLEVQPLASYELLYSKNDNLEKSKVIQARVQAAQQKQLARCGYCNGDFRQHHQDFFAQLNTEQKALLQETSGRFALSARTLHRLVSVARTIADLANSDEIELDHLQEALSYHRVQPYLDS